ncbi:MAG: hypothetical protein R3266_02885 [Gemmatimonadota bacterium]|nr:hypothetical protein [Gemmatimonadota bacterium]
MVEHLTREQIAALIDEPDAAADGRAHLDACERCAHEFEAMSRTRMALSGLPDLEAPEDGWSRIQAALAASGEAPPSVRSRGWLSSGPWGPALSAAAVLVLFLGGMGVGRMIAPDPSVAGNAARGETVADDSQLTSEYPEYVQTVAGLRELREGGPSTEELARNPALAAERLTRLDALIEASREALREAPADPALNDFLFDVVDERASVAGQLDQSLRQASMEY